MDMRAKNTGTFDHTTKSWRIKGRGIQVSIRQLSLRYGVPIEPSEKASVKWWRRYLQDIEDEHRAKAKAGSPLQERIRAIEGMIPRLEAEGQPEAVLERFRAMLRDAVDTPAHDIDRADTPVIPHPRVERLARQLGVDDPIGIGLLNRTVPRPAATTAPGSIRAEVDVMLAKLKVRGHKGYFQARKALGMFTSVTGDIRATDVTVHHFRSFMDKVTGHPSWSPRTKCNIAREVRSLLKRVAADYNLTFGFLENKAYMLHAPDGQKVQYTIDQVKTALKHATGNVRTMLLLGLNCGQYVGDIVTNTPAMLQDGHLVRVRAKLEHKAEPVKGSWLPWPETQAALTFGHKGWKLEEEYTAFRRQHQIPEHKALRKTTTQVIEDHVSGDVARLFRGEKVSGTHGKSYIQMFTPAQVAKLDEALRKVAFMYGLTVA